MLTFLVKPFKEYILEYGNDSAQSETWQLASPIDLPRASLPSCSGKKPTKEIHFYIKQIGR